MEKLNLNVPKQEEILNILMLIYICLNTKAQIQIYISIIYIILAVKPLNKEQLKAIVEKHPEGMITIEEHQASTGMGSAVVEQVNDMYSKGELATYPNIKRVAIPDEFAPIVGTQTYLREYEGLKID